MKLTDIKKQVRNELRFSIYIDNKYAFSLSQPEILKNGLKIGLDIDKIELKKLKSLASEDRIYIQTLKLVAARPKSEWEVKAYLDRKGASPSLIQTTLNKLSDLQLVDDFKFAEIYVRSLRLQSPASRRKIINKLRQKRVKAEAIEAALAEDDVSDMSALVELIKTKRKKYQDNTKLMAYLARQGFSYGDIKEALEVPLED